MWVTLPLGSYPQIHANVISTAMEKRAAGTGPCPVVILAVERLREVKIHGTSRFLPAAYSQPGRLSAGQVFADPSGRRDPGQIEKYRRKKPGWWPMMPRAESGWARGQVPCNGLSRHYRTVFPGSPKKLPAECREKVTIGENIKNKVLRFISCSLGGRINVRQEFVCKFSGEQSSI